MAIQKAIEDKTHDRTDDSWLKSCVKSLATLVTSQSVKSIERDFLDVSIKSNGVTLDLDSLLNNRAVTKQVSTDQQ